MNTHNMTFKQDSKQPGTMSYLRAGGYRQNTGRYYSICRTYYTDEEILNGDVADDMERILKSQTSLEGKCLEFALLDVMWKAKESQDLKNFAASCSKVSPYGPVGEPRQLTQTTPAPSSTDSDHDPIPPAVHTPIDPAAAQSSNHQPTQYQHQPNGTQGKRFKAGPNAIAIVDPQDKEKTRTASATKETKTLQSADTPSQTNTVESSAAEALAPRIFTESTTEAQNLATTPRHILSPQAPSFSPQSPHPVSQSIRFGTMTPVHVASPDMPSSGESTNTQQEPANSGRDFERKGRPKNRARDQNKWR